MKENLILYTIGHSTHKLEEFIELLHKYDIEQLIDIRTIPQSRYNPQFNGENLGHFLRNRHINYRQMKILGGLRKARVDSPNMGWRNASFRGFADYMQTPEFEKGLEELIELSGEKNTAIMCAETLPWRCHRLLIADALKIHGIRVKHIMSLSSTQDHELTSWAKVQGKKIVYPESDQTILAKQLIP